MRARRSPRMSALVLSSWRCTGGSSQRRETAHAGAPAQYRMFLSLPGPSILLNAPVASCGLSARPHARVALNQKGLGAAYDSPGAMAL